MMKVINPSLLLTFCLFLPTIGISKSDLVENCEYYKANSFDSRQLLNNALITTQTAPPPASANKIQYWTLPISNLSIVVPVDDYKMVGFFPDEENLKADSILLRGDTYEIHIGGVLQDLDKNNDVNSILDQLKLGAISNLSKLDCSTSSAEQDLKRMRAVSTKSLIFSGNGIYLNELDHSYNGFLYTSEIENSKVSWQSLFVSPDNQLIAYKISQQSNKDFKPIAGLLSQSNTDIELQSEQSAPEWLLSLGHIFGDNLDQIREEFVPDLEQHGFTLLDSGSLSMIALEKK